MLHGNIKALHITYFHIFVCKHDNVHITYIFIILKCMYACKRATMRIFWLRICLFWMLDIVTLVLQLYTSLEQKIYNQLKGITAEMYTLYAILSLSKFLVLFLITCSFSLNWTEKHKERNMCSLCLLFSHCEKNSVLALMYSA